MIKQIYELELPWEKLKNAKVLVTGANGMIASRLVEMLLETSEKKKLNLEVFAMCRNSKNAEKSFAKFKDNKNLHIIIADVTTPLTLNIDFQFIIHAASSAHPDAFNNTPVDVMKANFIGTLNLLEYVVKHKGTRFMFVSSSEIYGENIDRKELFNETDKGVIDCTTFRSCYPESKRASETLCMSYKKQYTADVIIVRPAYIYGKNILESNNRADVYFLRQVSNRKNIIMYSKGTQIRSYCYVDDCVAGMLYALLLGTNGEVYNIGNEECTVTLWDYAQKLANAAKVKLCYEPGNKPEDKVFLKTTKCILNTTKLRKLGWKPQYDLEIGIKNILDL